MLIPNDLRARTESAIKRICSGQAPMRVPVDPADPDVVLAEWLRVSADLASAGGSSVATLPELTIDLREILGRPNFTCHFIAKALRLMGFDSPKKSEEEQAVTIYWMLGHYLRDPVNWRDAASAELKAGAPAPPAQQ